MKKQAGGRLAEGILIVISILVAFAIDAWWQERQDRDEERRILNSLKVEFLVNAEKIPTYINSHRRSAKYSNELILTMQEAGPGGTVKFKTAQLGQIISHSSTDPQRGALDAILQSGELRYIRNPFIRERLAGWPQLIVDATENEDLLRTTWSPLFNAALVKRVDLTPVHQMDPECWRDELLEQCEIDEITLPYDTEVIGFLVHIFGYAEEAARELAIVAKEAKDIAMLIDQELAVP